MTRKEEVAEYAQKLTNLIDEILKKDIALSLGYMDMHKAYDIGYGKCKIEIFDDFDENGDQDSHIETWDYISLTDTDGVGALFCGEED